MTLKKTPDLSTWKKLGTMTTSLGKEFHLYESPDGKRVAQVDDELVIHMIIENGKPTYLNPKTTGSLKRMAELQKHLKESSKRPEL